MKHRIGITLASTLAMTFIGCAETETPPLEHTDATSELITEASVSALPPSAPVIAPAQAPLLVDISSAPRDVNFGAVGIHVVARDGAIVIQNVIAGMPADQAGLTADMVIRAVDGLPTDDMSLHQVVDLIRGDAGVGVTLAVEHGGVTAEHDIARESLVTTETRCDRVQRVRHETEFGGVGMQLRGEDDQFRIARVFDAMPAASAGVSEGHFVRAVDGMDVQGAAMVDVIAAIRGEVDAPVTLTLADNSGDTHEVTLARAAMVVPQSSTCSR